MAYTYQQAIDYLSHPTATVTEYGYFLDAIKTPEFSLRVIGINPGNSESIVAEGYFHSIGDKPIEVEDWTTSEKLQLLPGQVLEVPTLRNLVVSSQGSALLYYFSGNISGKPQAKDNLINVKETFDAKDTYWGRIESIVNQGFAGKRIEMKKGTQSSLEYHLHKKEAYYIESGALKVGLRVGRAENKSVILGPGDVFIIPQGMMHMRIALEDLVIIEASTPDDPNDTFFVEDGKRYVHAEI